MPSAVAIAEALGGTPAADGWKCRCPAHDDNHASLSLTVKDGKILLHCHAGCVQATVIAALKARGLWATKPAAAQSKAGPSKARIAATYDYTDELGALLFQVVRFTPKDFRQRVPDGPGKWSWKLGTTRRVLFKLPDILRAQAVVVVEGEKDALSLWKLDIPATCCPMGAGKWRQEYNRALAGRRVAVIADADTPGRQHAVQVCEALRSEVPSLRLLECPAPHKDVSDWIAAGATREQIGERIRGTAEWRAVPPEQPALPPPPAGTIIPPEYSEEALALEYADRKAGQHLYVHAWGRWLRWDGRCWSNDELGTGIYAVRELCRERAAALKEWLESQGAPTGAAKGIAGWRTVQNVERLARYDPRLAAGAAEFDRNPWLLNTPAGMVDLHTGNLRPHDPAERCSKITPAGPAGDAPLWRAFLERSTGGDVELLAFLQRWAGYCLTGDTREEALIFIHGPAAAGKSRYAEALQFILGAYGQAAPDELLIASAHDRHPAELADLQGARLVVATETQEGRAWDEQRIKKLTQVKGIRARKMRQDFFEFTPVLKLLVHGNHQPRLKNPDDAMRRRLLVVPFTHSVPEHERDQGLPAKLEAEAGGILAWAIEGCLNWQTDGLRPPAAVLDASERYFEAEDVVGRFIEENCVLGRKFQVTSAALWEAWEKYTQANGEKAGTPRTLIQALQKHGARSERTTKQRFFSGIGLKSNRFSGADTTESSQSEFDVDK